MYDGRGAGSPGCVAGRRIDGTGGRTLSATSANSTPATTIPTTINVPVLSRIVRSAPRTERSSAFNGESMPVASAQKKAARWRVNSVQPGGGGNEVCGVVEGCEGYNGYDCPSRPDAGGRSKDVPCLWQ